MPDKEASVTTREFLANATIILAVMAIGAVLEILVPMFVDKPWKRGRRSANLGLTALSFLSNWLLASVAGIAALSFRPAGVLAQRGVPFWAEIVIGILVLDFSVGYLSHRTRHMWPAMWRFHRIHHSDPFVDVTTTYRTHPVRRYGDFSSRWYRSGVGVLRSALAASIRAEPSMRSGSCGRSSLARSTGEPTRPSA